jgi:hypothetical protein
MATYVHLARRFAGSLRPGGPGARDRAWVGEMLSPAEHELWRRMPAPDRRHSVQVARRVAAMRADATRDVLAAALLHDVGKVHSGLGTFGRVVATVTIKLAGPSEVESWRSLSGLHRRIALYLDHGPIGGDDLALVESAPLVIAWTREHHRPRGEWTVPDEWSRVLDACDND